MLKNISVSKIGFAYKMENYLEVFRYRFSPKEDYRVSAFKYSSGTKFVKFSRSGKVFVITGACKLESLESQVELNAGEWCNFAEGEYEFSVTSDCEALVVNVWNLKKLRQATR